MKNCQKQLPNSFDKLKQIVTKSAKQLTKFFVNSGDKKAFQMFIFLHSFYF